MPSPDASLVAAFLFFTVSREGREEGGRISSQAKRYVFLFITHKYLIEEAITQTKITRCKPPMI